MMVNLANLTTALKKPVWKHIKQHTPAVANDLKNNGPIKQVMDAFDASLEIDSSLMHDDLESKIASHNMREAYKKL